MLTNKTVFCLKKAMVKPQKTEDWKLYYKSNSSWALEQG